MVIVTPGIFRFNISMLGIFSLLHYDFSSIFGVQSRECLNHRFIRHDFSSKFKSRFCKLDHKSHRKLQAFISYSWTCLTVNRWKIAFIFHRIVSNELTVNLIDDRTNKISEISIDFSILTPTISSILDWKVIRRSIPSSKTTDVFLM